MISDERLKELAYSAGLEPCDADPVYEGVMVGEVIAMAKELLALRRLSFDAIDVAAAVNLILAMSGYSASSVGRAEEKLMNKAAKVIQQAENAQIKFDKWARWIK